MNLSKIYFGACSKGSAIIFQKCYMTSCSVVHYVNRVMPIACKSCCFTVYSFGGSVFYAYLVVVCMSFFAFL